MSAKEEFNASGHKPYPGELVDAARAGNLKAVEALVTQYGVDVNERDQVDTMALMVAAFHGHPQILSFLIGKKANVNAQNKAGNTALILAATFGRLEMVRELIAAGADVNAQNGNGNTALLSAAANGHTEIIQLLLDNDAVDTANKFGTTALKVAEKDNWTDVVALLAGKQDAPPAKPNTPSAP